METLNTNKILTEINYEDTEGIVHQFTLPVANEFTLLLTGNYNYMTLDVCDKIINGDYIYIGGIE